jgi:hypothetical protein
MNSARSNQRSSGNRQIQSETVSPVNPSIARDFMGPEPVTSSQKPSDTHLIRERKSVPSNPAMVSSIGLDTTWWEGVKVVFTKL